MTLRNPTESPCGNDPVPLRRREAPVATHDGLLWPVPRGEMRDGDLIVRRLADDIRAVTRFEGDHDAVHRDDLRTLGWASLQIDMHFDAALDRYLNSSGSGLTARAGQPGGGGSGSAPATPAPLPLADAGSAA